VFSGAVIASRLADQEVVVTNTVPLPPDKRRPKITQLCVAPLFGEAIRRIHTGESVSEIFE
jgi:ribose-phosphate pyrophosphokinase